MKKNRHDYFKTEFALKAGGHLKNKGRIIPEIGTRKEIYNLGGKSLK